MPSFVKASATPGCTAEVVQASQNLYSLVCKTHQTLFTVPIVNFQAMLQLSQTSKLQLPHLLKLLQLSRPLFRPWSLPPYPIKPDLTPEERKAESVLLKERWTLMQLGFDRKRIKLRNKSIFVDSKLYGHYQNGAFQRSDFNPPLSQTTSTSETSESRSEQ